MRTLPPLVLVGLLGCDAAEEAQVFTCDAASFADDWSRFELPWRQLPPGGLMGWGRVPVSCGVDAGVRSGWWDITGDGERDLVFWAACQPDDAEPSVRVVPSRPGGLDTPAWWLLPEEPFERPAGCSLSDVQQYVDVDGDGLRDFLYTEDCEPGGIGASHWIIQRGQAQGWGSDELLPLPSTLPTPSGPDQTWSGIPRLDVEEGRLMLLDVDADGDQDFLQYPRTEHDASTWVVWPFEDGGWRDQPTELSLDGVHRAWEYDPFHVDPDDPLTSVSSCESGQRVIRRRIVDLVGDPRPDLVEMSDCDGAPDAWRVWEHHDGGFNGAPTLVTLPEEAVRLPDGSRAQVAQAIDVTPEGNECVRPDGTEAGLVLTLRDVLGLGRPQLVVLSGCTTAELGVATWHIYPLESGAFREEPLVVRPPVPERARNFPVGTWINGLPAHALTGDRNTCGIEFGLVDAVDLGPEHGTTLISTFDCGDEKVGQEYWLAAELRCDEPREITE